MDDRCVWEAAVVSAQTRKSAPGRVQPTVSGGSRPGADIESCFHRSLKWPLNCRKPSPALQRQPCAGSSTQWSRL